MSAIYDNWERLVRATIRREDLRLSALRTPSDLSLASPSPSLSSSSSFNFIPPSNQVSSFDFSNFSSVGHSFTYAQVLQATDNLSSSNLILIGRSGSLFHGVLEDGTKVVFKMVDSSSVDEVSFLMSELEFFARVSHPNFVPLLGYCFEEWNHKFLVYKYMPNEDLSTSFYMKTDSNNGPSTLLDWKMRLKVAIGVAQALCHLHHHCVPPLVHGNVEASSILIDENYDAHLGRLIQVCPEKKDRSQSRISKLLRLPKGSLQHTAGASDGTRAYDVYCFGKVLLELVTGYPVSSNLSNSEMTDWMENALPYITTYDEKLFENVMDPNLTKDEGVLDEVWTVAVVAKACLSPKPSKRPLMANVLKALEDLYVVAQAPAKLRIPEGSEVGTSLAATNGTSSDIRTTTRNSQFSPASGIEEAYRNREMWDLPNLIVFSFKQLKTATRNFSGDGLLGEGAFGIVYEGCLPEKSISKSGRESLIAVKRWRPDEGLQFEEYWRREIDILGRLSHPNLIKLLGYCSEDEERLLVYEYMPRGSLENHLFARRSAPLSWSTRLKILIGAARGLAYLHALMREVIFREFRTSSVLLDASYNAKISDFGFIKMGPSENETHVSTRVLGSSSYAAPEYVATGHLYVKSDVYGFGVVMAEVLTGLRAVDTGRSSEQTILTDCIDPHLSDKRKLRRSILDSRLAGRYPLQAAREMAQLAVTCLSPDPKDRPPMKQVVEKLEHIQIIGEKYSATPTPA